MRDFLFDVWCHIVSIFYMYLAGLTWLLEIIMFASIVFIPLVLYIRQNSDWFDAPFEEASYY